jgi:hypothetical protein
MRPGRGQRIAAAWAVRGQPCPAMGAELPVRIDLAAAITALMDQSAKLLLELQECSLLPARLGQWLLWLFVHGVPSVFPRSGARVSRMISGTTPCATMRCEMAEQMTRYCWRISFKVLEVLFSQASFPSFLPSKKADEIHTFRHFGVG